MFKPEALKWEAVLLRYIGATVRVHTMELYLLDPVQQVQSPAKEKMMTTTTTKDVSVLNTLIATLLDSIDGYQKSAGDIDNQALAERFNARARERQSAVAKLQAAVAAAGGNPEDDGTVLAGAHRAFLSLKEAVAGRDDKAIVAEVERGEDYLKNKFETALADADLSPASRSAAEEAWASVRAGHDEMSALKHSLGA